MFEIIFTFCLYVRSQKKLFNSEIAKSLFLVLVQAKSNCFVTHLVDELSIRNKSPVPKSFKAEV